MRCGREVTPKHQTSGTTKAFATIAGVFGGVGGFLLGGPLGAAAGAAGLAAITKNHNSSYEKDHSSIITIKYTCPYCGKEWTEEVHTGNSADTDWMDMSGH